MRFSGSPRTKGITLNLAHCLISVCRLEFVRRFIDGQGLHKERSKVQADLNFPEPHGVKEENGV